MCLKTFVMIRCKSKKLLNMFRKSFYNDSKTQKLGSKSQNLVNDPPPTIRNGRVTNGRADKPDNEAYLSAR